MPGQGSRFVVLDQLAERGLVERRQDVRQRVAVLEARREVGAVVLT